MHRNAQFKDCRLKFEPNMRHVLRQSRDNKARSAAPSETALAARVRLLIDLQTAQACTDVPVRTTRMSRRTALGRIVCGFSLELVHARHLRGKTPLTPASAASQSSGFC